MNSINAIIMAAGMSSRFAPLSYEIPKGLLKVKNEVLIERQIKQLQEKGINDIFNTAANGGNLYTITGLLYLLLGKIVDVYYSKRHQNTFGIYYIDQAIEYIEKNYMNRCSVEEVAGYLGLTRTYLYKIFKKYMDVSPTDYIENFRMEVACKLLLKGNIGISECAAAVGYDDRSYFSRVFKEEENCSPLQKKKKKRTLI